MIKFEDYIILKELYEQNMVDFDLNVKIKVDNSTEEFTNKIIDDFTLLIYKRSVKNLRPKRLGGYLQREEQITKKPTYRSTLSISMNNGDLIVGTYNTVSYHISISINGEDMYDLHLDGCNDDKLVEKMITQYVKYLQNKGYRIKHTPMD